MGKARTYILYDCYETETLPGEEIGRYDSYAELKAAAKQRMKDTSGECDLRWTIAGD